MGFIYDLVSFIELVGVFLEGFLLVVLGLIFLKAAEPVHKSEVLDDFHFHDCAPDLKQLVLQEKRFLNLNSGPKLTIQIEHHNLPVFIPPDLAVVPRHRYIRNPNVIVQASSNRHCVLRHHMNNLQILSCH